MHIGNSCGRHVRALQYAWCNACDGLEYVPNGGAHVRMLHAMCTWYVLRAKAQTRGHFTVRYCHTVHTCITYTYIDIHTYMHTYMFSIRLMPYGHRRLLEHTPVRQRGGRVACAIRSAVPACSSALNVYYNDVTMYTLTSCSLLKKVKEE